MPQPQRSYLDPDIVTVRALRGSLRARLTGKDVEPQLSVGADDVHRIRNRSRQGRTGVELGIVPGRGIDPCGCSVLGRDAERLERSPLPHRNRFVHMEWVHVDGSAKVFDTDVPHLILADHYTRVAVACIDYA
ncbi:hypothetical protein A8144_07290 [Mycobacterium leprae 3125609]|nr:hypothetical protein A8144_07290 [Mycobacterium leprae 3125609]OAX71363.1 hypothetical protein A3216_06210 [Mycobacterium leprae 7935681]